MDSVALSVVGQEELDPTRPEEHGTRDAPYGLTCVALLEYAQNGYHQTNKAHEEGRDMECGRSQKVFHQNHEGVTQRHEQQNNKEGTQGLAEVYVLIFH